MTTPPPHGQAAPPPGWYDNNGSRQWWDGTSWGPVAPSAPEAPNLLHEASPGVVVKKRNPFGSVSIVLAILALPFILIPKASTGLGVGLAVLAITLAIFGLLGSQNRRIGSSVVGLVMSLLFTTVGITGLQQPVEGPSSSTDASGAIEDTAVSAPSPEQQRDTQMQEQGFVTWQSGETWLKAADPNSFTCDAGTSCLWYTLASFSGCPAGFYVKADIVNENDLAIGWTNEITASVAAQDAVAFQLRTTLNGSAMLPTEVSCMGS